MFVRLLSFVLIYLLLKFPLAGLRQSASVSDIKSSVGLSKSGFTSPVAYSPLSSPVPPSRSDHVSAN